MNPAVFPLLAHKVLRIPRARFQQCNNTPSPLLQPFINYTHVSLLLLCQLKKAQKRKKIKKSKSAPGTPLSSVVPNVRASFIRCNARAAPNRQLLFWRSPYKFFCLVGAQQFSSLSTVVYLSIFFIRILVGIYFCCIVFLLLLTSNPEPFTCFHNVRHHLNTLSK